MEGGAIGIQWMGYGTMLSLWEKMEQQLTLFFSINFNNQEYTLIIYQIKGIITLSFETPITNFILQLKKLWVID